MLRRARSLLPQPRFHSKYPDTKGVSFEYVGFILQHIVQQQQREQDEELPVDLTNKPHRVIPVDPFISPFDSGENKVPREDPPIPYWSPEHPSPPDLVLIDTP